MATDRQKAPDEIFCRSCGEAIKKRADICPECGVRNDGLPASAQVASRGSSPHVHDPSQYETSVSDSWWYGVAGGIALWALLVGLLGAGADLGTVGGLAMLVAWIGLPVAVYFDIQYVRANTNWSPNSAFWVLVLTIWLVNIIVGAIYLHRRHEVLGEP